MTPQEKLEIYDLMYEEYGDVGQNGNVIKLFERLLDTKLKQQLEKIESEIEEKYPYFFIEEIDYGKGILKNGKQEETQIRRLNESEESVLNDIKAIISKYKEMK